MDYFQPWKSEMIRKKKQDEAPKGKQKIEKRRILIKTQTRNPKQKANPDHSVQREKVRLPPIKTLSDQYVNEKQKVKIKQTTEQKQS
jgi:hypothetical protein